MEYLPNSGQYYNPKTRAYYYATNKIAGESNMLGGRKLVTRFNPKPKAFEYYPALPPEEKSVKKLSPTLEMVESEGVIPIPLKKNEESVESIKFYHLRPKQPVGSPTRLIPKHYPFYFDPDKQLYYQIEEHLYYERSTDVQSAIYYEPYTKVYYYPKSVLENPNRETVPIVKGAPVLIQDPNMNLYYDPKRNEQYYIAQNFRDLDRIKESMGSVTLPKIFYDPALDMLFYPYYPGARNQTKAAENSGK